MTNYSDNNDVPAQSLQGFAPQQSGSYTQELPDTKPLALVKNDGTIIYCNQSFSLLFYTRGGDNITRLDSDPHLGVIVQNLCLSDYNSFNFDIYVRNEKTYEVEGYFVDIERVFIGTSEYFALIFSLSKERSEIENRIGNLHNALEYGDIAVIITDDKGIISYSSQTFEKIIGKNLEQLYHRPVTEILSEFIQADEVETLQQAIQEKTEWVSLISTTNNQNKVAYKEIRLNPVRPNGVDSENFIITANDITEYVLKNRIIEKSEKRQKSIINNISDLLLIIRSEEKKLVFENANDNFYSIFRLDKKDAHKNLKEYIPEDLYKILVKAVNMSKDSSKKTLQFRYSEKTFGKEYLGKITFIDDPYDKYRIFIVSLTDITEQLKTEFRLRKAYEKEIQLNKLKSAFLANMSHEIRTPINAIIGYAEILGDDISGKNYDSLPEVVTSLKDGVLRLLNLIDNIVEVSILESGDCKLDLEEIKINNILEDLYQNYSKMNNPKNIKLKINPDPGDPAIRVDDVKIRKILEVLIENAIKYNKPNGVVSIKSQINNDKVEIRISDSGIGIPPRMIKAILEPFSQVEEEGYKRNYEGAGLGLTIADKLTTLLKGNLKVDSKLDVGTAVSLTFPLAKPSSTKNN